MKMSGITADVAARFVITQASVILGVSPASHMLGLGICLRTSEHTSQSIMPIAHFRIKQRTSDREYPITIEEQPQ